MTPSDPTARPHRVIVVEHRTAPTSVVKADTEALADVIVKAIRAATAPLERRIADLETRGAAGCEYRGVFSMGKVYKSGSLVSKGGGLWLSLSDTTLSPGSNPTAWKLVVKSGGAEQ